jgi:uncharacterized protein
MPFEIGRRCIDFLLTNAREADAISLRGRKREINVTFWGGEPMIEWELLQRLVSYAEKAHKEIPLKMGMTTNGTLLSKDRMKFFSDHRLAALVSFDGTAESHDRYRHYHDGRGSQAVVAANIEKALKVHPALRVRMSPYAEGIHRFYGDVKYIVDMGLQNLMFSPVYEGDWTPRRWATFHSECERVTELILDCRKKGTIIEIEHYRSYSKTDKSRWPCGAGRFYVGFDVDGAIYPCHRFIKFPDRRHWSKKGVCLGHVDYGIINQAFRDQFIDFKPTNCDRCKFDKLTPCHGGCYAVNYDLTGNIRTAPQTLCDYTKMQSEVSRSYREQYGPNGFPEVREQEMPKPTPDGIMAVLAQMDKKISLIEGILCHAA